MKFYCTHTHIPKVSQYIVPCHLYANCIRADTLRQNWDNYYFVLCCFFFMFFIYICNVLMLEILKIRRKKSCVKKIFHKNKHIALNDIISFIAMWCWNEHERCFFLSFVLKFIRMCVFRWRWEDEISGVIFVSHPI